jgi:hypothetical protein
MILAIHQPNFMPWLGFFDKMRSADRFVILDDVQFIKNEFHNRNRIHTPQGALWLTVPVHFSFGDAVTRVRLAERPNWREKHVKTLHQMYCRAKHFRRLMPELEKLYARPWTTLVDLNLACIELGRELLRVRTPVCRHSESPAAGTATERLVNLCKMHGADTYLAGAGGKSYMDLSLFERAGISVRFQDYRHPIYPQFGGEFMSHLCFLDLVFHAGSDAGKVL